MQKFKLNIAMRMMSDLAHTDDIPDTNHILKPDVTRVSVIHCTAPESA